VKLTNFIRMDWSKFNELLSLVEPLITKKRTKFRSVRKEGIRKKERGGREKGEGRGVGQGWEGKFRGTGGREGKGVGKREGEGKFRGARPPKSFFIEPRLVTTICREYSRKINSCLWPCTFCSDPLNNKYRISV